VIRIRKPPAPPAVLHDRGAAATAEVCAVVTRGERPTFDRTVYGAADVKQALKTAQHDKCCFCEAKLSHTHPGDVEHFRPKARAQQDERAPPTTGYYWLAYEWDNLYLSCEECNRRHKRGLFPLTDPTTRVGSHVDAHRLADERPLFIDPGHDDPETFIEFRREYAAAVDGHPRGDQTWRTLALNRPPLVERRRERLASLKACAVLVKLLAEGDLREDLRDEAVSTLRLLTIAATNHAEYASMARALLREIAPWRAAWAGPPADLLEDLRRDAREGRALRLPLPLIP
jgi:uncharacterized protein (TIGR02646 family)